LVYSPGAHPDLHSFPTRRSSDLSNRNRLRSFWSEPINCFSRDSWAFRLPLSRIILIFCSNLALASIFSPLLRPQPVFCRRGKATDRKSTRLNSSHVKISYAVFCL